MFELHSLLAECKQLFEFRTLKDVCVVLAMEMMIQKAKEVGSAVGSVR